MCLLIADRRLSIKQWRDMANEIAMLIGWRTCHLTHRDVNNATWVITMVDYFNFDLCCCWPFWSTTMRSHKWYNFMKIHPWVAFRFENLSGSEYRPGPNKINSPLGYTQTTHHISSKFNLTCAFTNITSSNFVGGAKKTCTLSVKFHLAGLFT